MIPTYLPGRENLKELGYNETHDTSYAIFGYIKEINTERPDGSFYKRKILQWGSCRDGFQGTNDNELIPGFCFTHAVRCGYDASCFLAKIESTLGIPNSVYRLTEYNAITFIKPSPWWFSSIMRKSFFSLMLRAAYGYNAKTNNFEEALFGFNYTKETKTAVNKFLAGYTVYEYAPRDSCDHWFRQFTNPANPYGNKWSENTANIANLKPGTELITRKSYELWMQGTASYDQDLWTDAEKLLKETA